MPVRNRFAELVPEITAWRRDLHAHPELQYDVHRTAGVVADKLRAFGCDEVVEGIGRTGVVGLIHGAEPGRTIGLRADMDALPILEATGAGHASTTPGKMHACGHDGHTAMLLGAAKYLAETRNFTGTVAVVFQPAEEGGAGADAMVRDELIARFDIAEIYGMHNSPLLPAGTFAIRSGPFYAAVDSFRIDVQGARRPCGAAPQHRRHHADRPRHRRRPAIGRRAQHRSAAAARRVRHGLSHRHGRLQRHPRHRPSARHHPQLRRRHPRKGADRYRAHRRHDRRGPWGNGDLHIGRGALSRHGRTTTRKPATPPPPPVPSRAT